jgi:hypothetical protein
VEKIFEPDTIRTGRAFDFEVTTEQYGDSDFRVSIGVHMLPSVIICTPDGLELGQDERWKSDRIDTVRLLVSEMRSWLRKNGVTEP